MEHHGFGHGRGRGRRHGRGRSRGQRWITSLPEITFFKPVGVEQDKQKVIFLTMEELEAVRLVDLEDMLQEEAAFQMGVSRKTMWNDLKSARKKIAIALIKGWAIKIEGGNYILRDIEEDVR